MLAGYPVIRPAGYSVQPYLRRKEIEGLKESTIENYFEDFGRVRRVRGQPVVIFLELND